LVVAYGLPAQVLEAPTPVMGVPDLLSSGGYVDLAARDTIRLPIYKIKSPAIVAPHNVWLSTWRYPVVLTTRANSLPMKQKHKQEQRSCNLELQMKVLTHKLGFHKLINSETAKQNNLSKTQTLMWVAATVL
jgi:hypothetical protein